MNTQSNLFPCPECGVARGQGGIACKECGWDPSPIRTETTLVPEARNAGCGWIGFVIIIASIYFREAIEAELVLFFLRYPGEVEGTIALVPVIGVLVGVAICIYGFGRTLEPESYDQNT